MQQDKAQSQEALLTIIHFNDVYDIQPGKQGKKGICNFQAYIRQLREEHKNNLLLFSGDAFSPSILTNVHEGEQMVFALNKLGIDVSCYGNHQFDLEEVKTVALAKACNFPWLLGNIRHISDESMLGDGIPFVTKEVNGKKIGIFGIAGEDWIGILSDEYEDELEYNDAYQHSKKMCQVLKNQHNCDMIIALTHMRVPQDRELAKRVPQIDIILGGHDHIVFNQVINQIPVIKSGDNFKSLGLIQVYDKKHNPQLEGRRYGFDVKIKHIPITQNPDKQLKEYVDKCMLEYNQNDKIIGYTDVELNTKFSDIRTKETNYGNFVTDLIKLYYECDCCAINSGFLRPDAIIKPGPLKLSMISNVINDVLVVKNVPGSAILQMLEYACAGCPDNYVGSFLFVSGIQYHFNCKETPRVKYVAINGQQLNSERIYTLATHSYIGRGGDGFEMLKEYDMSIDQAMGIDTLELILKFFKGEHLDQQKSESQIEQMYPIQEDFLQVPDFPAAILSLSKKISNRYKRITQLRKRFVVGPKGKRHASIAPCLDGRIKYLQ